MSSSSECDCGECSHYDTGLGYNDNGYSSKLKNPFYPTMGNPLIYYAQVPPVNIRQISRKRNPNCFVKAFRWYTEEHTPPRRSPFSRANPEIPGFAAWLDTKYYQFLRDSQLDQTLYHVKLKQTSTIEATKMTPNATCAPCSTKKKSRIKSRWRKRSRQSKEKRDVLQRCNYSVEYILQPKELTRPVSECCHPTNTSCCYQSKTTVASTDAQGSKRTIVKSQSLTSVRLVNNNTITTTAEEGLIISNQTQEETQKDMKLETKAIVIPKVQAERRVPEKILPAQNISCQCSVDITAKVNAHTQYESSQTTSWSDLERKYKTRSVDRGASISPLHTSTRNDSEAEMQRSAKRESVRAIYNNTNISCQCSVKHIQVDAQSQYRDETRTRTQINKIQETGNSVSCSCRSSKITETRPTVSVKETDSLIVKNLETLTKTTRSFTIFVNDAAQTSDHSISLEKDTNEYPLFMKIICADKLFEELR